MTTSQSLEFDSSNESSDDDENMITTNIDTGDDDDDDDVDSTESVESNNNSEQHRRVQLSEIPDFTNNHQQRRIQMYNILPDKWIDNNLPIPDNNIFDETGHVIQRRRWTTPEKIAIKAGISKYKNDWIAIKKHYAHILRNRTNVQCKDCYRTMVRLCECERIIYQRIH